MTQTHLIFDGQDISPVDAVRLTKHMQRVIAFLSEPDMKAYRGTDWWTLKALAFLVGCSESSVSARLRDLRKPRFGGHTIERRRVSGGLWEYRMVGK